MIGGRTLSLYIVQRTKKGKVIQVKSGRIKPSDVRDFCHVVERESAEMNFFVSLRKQSKEITLAFRK